MKNKNLFYSVAAALLLTAGLSSCSGDDEVTTPVVENNHTVKLTATLGAKSGDATRALDADGKTTWAVNEQIAVYYQKTDDSYATGTATVTEVDASGTATIEAELTAPEDGESTVKLVYPASLANTEGGIDKTKLLSNQVGTISDISTNWDAATNNDVTLTVNGSTASLPDDVALTNQLCIVKYALKDASGNNISAKPLVINDGTNEYTVTPEDATNELYVAMLPVTSASVTFTATVGSDTYSKTYSNITLAAGKYYKNSTVKLEKEAARASYKELNAVTTGEIGWRIGSDGKAYDTDGVLPSGVTACAIIAYVGSETAESGYTHGLAIAMRDAGSSTKWTITGGSNDNTNQYTTIDAALAAKESGSVLSSGRDSDTWPAFKAALNNSIRLSEGDGVSAEAPSGTSGWFLPSIYQWNQIVNGLTGTTTAFTSTGTNNALQQSAFGDKIIAAGGEQLQSDYYRSSTEYNSYNDWIYSARNGRAITYNKEFGLYVRAVFAF